LLNTTIFVQKLQCNVISQLCSTAAVILALIAVRSLGLLALNTGKFQTLIIACLQVQKSGLFKDPTFSSQSELFESFSNCGPLKSHSLNMTESLADSSAIRFRNLQLSLRSSLPSAVADFASACIYLCFKNCLVLIFKFVLRFLQKKTCKPVINLLKFKP